MPSKKKKYNARFPAGRIKKIMQTDEEVGKVAQAVPVIISRTLELFVESLLTKSAQITQARSAKTLTPSHMKQCILSESRFDFLKDLVKNIPDASTLEDSEYSMPLDLTPPLEPFAIPPPIYEELEYKPQFYVEQGTSSKETTVSEAPSEPAKIDYSIASLVQKDPQPPQIHHIDLTNIVVRQPPTDIPPLIPLARFGHQSTNDNLCIDEDYDN